MRLPARFLDIPAAIAVCNAPATPGETSMAHSVRREYVIPSVGAPYIDDIVRAFRLAAGAGVYIEVGTQDKGNIAWMARTFLRPGATIIDIDMVDYPDNDERIRAELSSRFDYHAIRGNCLSDETLAKVKAILAGRGADIIFCDSHYTYAHTMTEFGIYYPLVRQGGFLLFHDAQWPGDPSQDGEFGQQGKALAIAQLDRFYSAYMVQGPDTPVHRPVPTVSRNGNWGSLAIFPA